MPINHHVSSSWLSHHGIIRNCFQCCTRNKSFHNHLSYPSAVRRFLFYRLPYCESIKLDTAPKDNINPPRASLPAELVAPVAEAIGAPELDETLDPEALASVGIVSLAFWKPLWLGPEVMPVLFVQTSGVGGPDVKVMSAHCDSVLVKE